VAGYKSGEGRGWSDVHPASVSPYGMIRSEWINEDQMKATHVIPGMARTSLCVQAGVHLCVSPDKLTAE
jgi:hypothetical protein